jgi:hypothetical protein
VSRLAPFGVRFLMAVTTVFGRREGFRIYKLTSICSRIRRQEGFVLAKSKIVVLFDRLGVNLPLSGGIHGVRCVSAALLQGYENARGCSAEHCTNYDSTKTPEGHFHKNREL